MQSFTITEVDALDIARQSVAPSAATQLVAVDYNWGPPVSGRFDSDFLQIWAAARTALGPRAVRLRGTYGPGGSWSNALSFRYVRTAGDNQLYLLISEENKIAEVATVLAPDRPNLAVRLAAAVVRAWKDSAMESNLVDWLMQRGVEDLKTARRVARIRVLRTCWQQRKSAFDQLVKLLRSACPILLEIVTTEPSP